MITAKMAKEGTKIDKYIKEKCAEIEESIQLSMDLGLSYYRYNAILPSSIQEMLISLGYKVHKTDDMLMGIRYIISWGDAPDTDEFECN